MVRKKRLLAGVLSFALALSALVINPTEAKAAGLGESVKKLKLDTTYTDAFTEEEREETGAEYGFDRAIKVYRIDIPKDGTITARLEFPENPQADLYYYTGYYLTFRSVDDVDFDNIDNSLDHQGSLLYYYDDSKGCYYTEGTQAQNGHSKWSLKKGAYYVLLENILNADYDIPILTCQYNILFNYTADVERPFIYYESGEKKAKLIWEKVKGADGYEIEYSEYSYNDGSLSNTKRIVVKNKKTTNKVLSNLKRKTLYVVKIRSYKKVKVNGKNKRYYSEWDETIVETE